MTCDTNSTLNRRGESSILQPLEPVDLAGSVSYGDFAALAHARGWAPEFLAEKFRGVIEEPSAFFHRVLGGKLLDVVIPFGSVLRFYYAELSPLVAEGAVRVCRCGCGSRLYGRREYATGRCRVRALRQRPGAGKRGSEKPRKHKGFSVTKSGGGYLPLNQGVSGVFGRLKTALNTPPGGPVERTWDVCPCPRAGGVVQGRQVSRL